MLVCRFVWCVVGLLELRFRVVWLIVLLYSIETLISLVLLILLIWCCDCLCSYLVFGVRMFVLLCCVLCFGFVVCLIWGWVGFA